MIREEPTLPPDGIEDLPSIALAQKVCAELCISDKGMPFVIGSAIDFLVKFEGHTKHSAVEFLIQRAHAKIAKGETPTRFWFSEREWRKDGSGNGPSQPAKSNGIAAIAELKKREKQGEKFYTWADVLEDFKKAFPNAAFTPDRNGKAMPLKTMPSLKSSEQLKDSEEILRQQKERILGK